MNPFTWTRKQYANVQHIAPFNQATQPARTRTRKWWNVNSSECKVNRSLPCRNWIWQGRKHLHSDNFTDFHCFLVIIYISVCPLVALLKGNMPKMSPLSCLVHMKKSSYFNILCVLIRVGFFNAGSHLCFRFPNFHQKEKQVIAQNASPFTR